MSESGKKYFKELHYLLLNPVQYYRKQSKTQIKILFFQTCPSSKVKTQKHFRKKGVFHSTFWDPPKQSLTYLQIYKNYLQIH